MLGGAIRKSRMVEGQLGIGPLRVELEPNDRIDPLRPISGAPRLDDALIWNQFHISPRDHAVETGEGTACLGRDSGRRTAGELAEPLCIEQRLVDALWVGLEDHFLPNNISHDRCSVLAGSTTFDER